MRWLNQHPHQLVETSEHCSVLPSKYGGSPINRSSKVPSYARPRARRRRDKAEIRAGASLSVLLAHHAFWRLALGPTGRPVLK